MRVLQVVALVDREGAYGGPTTVAYEQSRALREAGHQVTLLAGWDGHPQTFTDADTVLRRARKLSSRTFASLASPRAIAWFMQHHGNFDVVHVHLARDLVTMPIAAWRAANGRPIVVQPHGMLQPRGEAMGRAFDATISRPLLRAASAVITLTDTEEVALRRLGVETGKLKRVENAVSPAARLASFEQRRPLVVFASRLAARKRPTSFVDMAALVRLKRPDARFEIWGADEGEATAVLERILALGLTDICQYRGPGSAADIRGLFSRSQVMVLPSFGEPFPMTALEAFAAGLPSVLTHDTGVSDRAGSYGAAAVTNGSAECMADAVVDLLGRTRWAEVSEAALHLHREQFTLASMAERLVETYLNVVGDA